MQLVSMNVFILCDNWKTLFFLKVCRYFEIFVNCQIVVFFETSVLKEVLILRCLHDNSAVLILNFKIKNV